MAAEMKLRILALLLFLPVLVWAQAKPAANQGPWRLVGVRATGSERFPEADIIATTGLKIGDNVVPEQFKAAADRLAALGAFEEVAFDYGPAGTGVTVEFKLADTPQFLATKFDNFVWFSDQELMDAVRKSVPLFHGEVPPEGEMTAAVTDALQALLVERRLPGHVRFQLEEEKPGAPIHSGVFIVDGVNLKIAEVDFPGAQPEDLPLLQKAAKPLLDIPYQRSTARSFAEFNLPPVYRQRGYLKAQFAEPTARLLPGDAASPAVAVSIPVTPGLQYRLGALRWSGNGAIQTADLDKLLHLRVAAPADALQLGRDLDSVHTAYAARGYLRQDTRAIPTWNDSVQVVSYELRVNEGDQYKFAGVEITGLERRVRDRVREVWSLREGEPYDPGYIKTFLHAAVRLLPPGAITRVQQDINDKQKTVDVTVHFDFQKPTK